MAVLSQDEYRGYCREFKRVEGYLRSKSADADTVAYNICKLRGYYEDRMSGILKKAGFMFIEDNSVYEDLKGAPKELGLFSKSGQFLLAGRFMFPVRDMLGNTLALIGWFPDEKKYITTPSMLFSKASLFYGLEQVGSEGIGKDYFLCEGIFDCLSIRSVGLRAVAEMGISSSRYKEALYPLFGRLVAVPDNDTQGRGVVEGDKWNLPLSGSYMKWVGDDSKDIDKLVNKYEKEDVVGLLESVMAQKGRRVVEVRV